MPLDLDWMPLDWMPLGELHQTLFKLHLSLESTGKVTLQYRNQAPNIVHVALVP
jgi:hypothetical protein